MQAIVDLFTDFGVTWDRLLAQLITFAVLLIILRLFLYKPMLKMLDERKQRIAQGLKDADEAGKAKVSSEKEAAARLKEATRQAEELLAEAKKSAETLKAEIQAQTQAELQKARQDQTASLERARQQMIDEVRQDVVKLVVATTTKVLQTELSQDQQRQVTKQAAKELE